MTKESGLSIQDLLEIYIDAENKYTEIHNHFAEVDEVRKILLLERDKKALPLTKLCSSLIPEKFIRSKNGDFYRITENGIWKLKVE